MDFGTLNLLVLLLLIFSNLLNIKKESAMLSLNQVVVNVAAVDGMKAQYSS